MKNKIITFLLILGLFAVTSNAVSVGNNQPGFVDSKELIDRFYRNSYANEISAYLFSDIPAVSNYFHGRAEAYMEARIIVESFVPALPQSREISSPIVITPIAFQDFYEREN